MAATILALIVGSFACWCAWQCFKPQEKNGLEKGKDNDAMHRRFKDVELPGDWTKSIRPSVSPAAGNQASRQASSAATGSIRSGSSSAVRAHK